MPKVKTTTWIEYPIKEFNDLITKHIFAGKDVELSFIIEKVGADPLDRFPGHDEVTKVRITFDGVPPL